MGTAHFPPSKQIQRRTRVSLSSSHPAPITLMLCIFTAGLPAATGHASQAGYPNRDVFKNAQMF